MSDVVFYSFCFVLNPPVLVWAERVGGGVARTPLDVTEKPNSRSILVIVVIKNYSDLLEIASRNNSNISKAFRTLP